MRIRSNKGALLILVLLIISVLFVMCVGFLSTKSQEAMVANQARDSFQAREIAFSGLETVRVKMLNDPDFPPAQLGPSQEIFEISEEVLNFDGSESLGRYQLHCDRRWMDEPYSRLRVTSIGQFKDQTGNPVRHKLVGEFSTAPGERGTMTNFTDLGAF